MNNNALITLRTFARTACVTPKTIYRRLKRNGIEIVKLEDGRLAVDAKTAADLLTEMITYKEEYWTGLELAQALGVKKEFIRQAGELGLIKRTYCRMRAGFRFTQEDIQEFLYRLEFANPTWREERTAGVKNTLIMDLIDSYHEFPSVEEWEKIRTQGFKEMCAKCWRKPERAILNQARV